MAITAGAEASFGTVGKTAGSSTGSSNAGKQARGCYYKGMAVFTCAKGGFMYETALGGQKYSFKPHGKKK